MTLIIFTVIHQKTSSPELHTIIRLCKYLFLTLLLMLPQLQLYQSHTEYILAHGQFIGSLTQVLKICFISLFYSEATASLEILSGIGIFVSPLLCLTRLIWGNVLFDSECLQIIFHLSSFERFAISLYP